MDFFKLYNQGERRQAQYVRETRSVKILSSIIPQVTLADPSHLPPTDWSQSLVYPALRAWIFFYLFTVKTELKM